MTTNKHSTIISIMFQQVFFRIFTHIYDSIAS